MRRLADARAAPRPAERQRAWGSGACEGPFFLRYQTRGLETKAGCSINLCFLWGIDGVEELKHQQISQKGRDSALNQVVGRGVYRNHQSEDLLDTAVTYSYDKQSPARFRMSETPVSLRVCPIIRGTTGKELQMIVMFVLF